MTLSPAPGGDAQDYQWFVIRSFHVLRFTSRGGRPIAYCGRMGEADAPIADHLRIGKSCESCLRIVARAADA